jgi:hypothetical protein
MSSLSVSTSPATEALEAALTFVPTRIPMVGELKPMICTKNLKRSSSGSFDMSAFTEASQQVEDAIAFPSIEWSFDDSDSEEEEYSPASKRRCRGIARSENSSDLFTLGSKVRFESAGCLC